jgi:hypothetical protein
VAIATYNKDLTDIWAVNSITGWTEMTNHTGGGAATAETDYYIEGTGCVSQSTGTKSGTNAGLEFDYGSNVTINSGECVFVWQVLLAGNAIDTLANGGLRVAIGSSTGNVNFWKSGGSDFGRNPYGGWQNVAIDPTFTADYTEGTPAGTYRIFGSLPNLTAVISKGNMHGVDAIRKGRGQLYVEFGQALAYGKFSGMAAANDASTARWGLFQQTLGGYLWKGLMSLGTATNAVDFRDSNVNIFVDNTYRTYAAFNKIEIKNTSSRVDWTAVSIQSSPHATYGNLSPGRFEVVDDCDVNFEKCVFTDMDTFIFKVSSACLNGVFRRCNTITANGASFAGCLFDSASVAANTSQLIWDVATDPGSYLANTTFIMGANLHHAIELGTTSPTTITLTNVVFTGFNASNGQNDSMVHVKRTTGTVTINYSGAAPSYKSDGATVVLQTSVSLKVTCKNEAALAVAGVKVRIQKTSDKSLVAEGTTDGTGVVSTSTGSSGYNVDVIARLKGYKPVSASTYLGATGIDVPFTLIRDKAVDLP